MAALTCIEILCHAIKSWVRADVCALDPIIPVVYSAAQLTIHSSQSTALNQHAGTDALGTSQHYEVAKSGFELKKNDFSFCILYRKNCP
jgi:hypothetical protein